MDVTKLQSESNVLVNILITIDLQFNNREIIF
jgi:hypothetical protein